MSPAHSQTPTEPAPAFFNFGADVVDRMAATADGPALVWCDASGREERYSFSDIARLTAKLASGLRAHGVRKGDRVIVMLPRIPQWQIAMVACMKLGAIPIPSIEMLTSKDLAYRCGHAQVKAVIARSEHAGKFAGFLPAEAVRVSVGEAEGWLSFADVLAGGSEAFAPERLAADEPALLYYTSGSTGQPKGVLHATRAVFAWRESARAWLDLGRADTIWCTADTGWSKAGTSILFGPWSLGSCSFFYDGPFDAKDRLRLLEKYRITVYCAPGTELFRLVAEDVRSYDLRCLRRTVTAGEALSTTVAQHWQAATGLVVAEAYGQTETLMSLGNPAGMQPRIGSMGLPLPGCEVAVLDDDCEPLPAGQEGDLALLAPNPQFMLGYLGEPERTGECYVTDRGGRTWFVTGDRAERDPEGFFHHRGRRDDIINSAGYRIGPGEVENALLAHPDVLEVAAVGIPDRERGEIVKAFIVLRAGCEASEALKVSIQEHAKRTTAPYKYPRAIEFVPSLPKTLTGKVQRMALRIMELQRLAQASGKA